MNSPSPSAPKAENLNLKEVRKETSEASKTVQTLTEELQGMLPEFTKTVTSLSVSDNTDAQRYLEQFQVLGKIISHLEEMHEEEKELYGRKKDLTPDQMQNEHKALARRRLMDIRGALNTRSRYNADLFINVSHTVDNEENRSEHEIDKLALRSRLAKHFTPRFNHAREKAKLNTVERITEETKEQLAGILDQSEAMLEANFSLAEVCKKYLEIYFELYEELLKKQAAREGTQEIPPEIQEIDTSEIDEKLKEKYGQEVFEIWYELFGFMVGVSNEDAENMSTTTEMEVSKSHDKIEISAREMDKERKKLILEEQLNKSRSLPDFNPARIKLTMEIEALEEKVQTLIDHLSDTGGFVGRVADILKLLGITAKDQQQGKATDPEERQVNLFVVDNLNLVRLRIDQIMKGMTQRLELSTLGSVLGYEENLQARQTKIEMRVQQEKASQAPDGANQTTSESTIEPSPDADQGDEDADVATPEDKAGSAEDASPADDSADSPQAPDTPARADQEDNEDEDEDEATDGEDKRTDEDDKDKKDDK